MYNRYIPNSSGIYQRRTVEEPKPEPRQETDVCPQAQQECCEIPKETKRRPPQSAQSGFDLGDLLLLCILLLLVLDAEQEDLTPLLLAAAVLLFQ